MPKNWECYLDEDGAHFVSPEKFIFSFKEDAKIIDTINALHTRPPEFGFTHHNERFRLDGDNKLRVISCDPWINGGFSIDSVVCDGLEFFQVLLWYIAQEMRNWKFR